MKRVSAFDTLRDYLVDVIRAARSVWRSCAAALPYLVSAGEFRKEVTEQYPDPISSRSAEDLPARTRGLLYNDIEKCTGCSECARICPTDCFSIEMEPAADPNKVWVSLFDINFSKCIFCGLCVEVCQPASLVHTRKYEGATLRRKDQVGRFGRGQITPEQKEKWALQRRRLESEEHE